MNAAGSNILLVGEVFVDFTITKPGQENKLRLGGITHAARGFWALKTPFSAAVVLPDYLEGSARDYFSALGCVDFHIIGRIKGAPNVTVIVDPIELADQEYETLLRDEKSIELSLIDLRDCAVEDVLVFPGSYDLKKVCDALPNNARLHIDAAYDIADPKDLTQLNQPIDTVLISTSSPLFKSLANSSLAGLKAAFEVCAPASLILKENRGGARMVLEQGQPPELLPAQLGTTVNSVGVGDVFSAAYVAHKILGRAEAGWRATYAAAAYSQTTFPDVFETYVQRDLKLTLDQMRQLGGTSLPWETRNEYPIYLAAPDFTHGDRRAIEKVIASLGYHNFRLRRPVIENGELPAGSNSTELDRAFHADKVLLKECKLLFAVPTGRDPGTLVEIGMAIEARIPVVVYDPTHENANTMVMAGAQHYSDDLDSCLNAVFCLLSQARCQ